MIHPRLPPGVWPLWLVKRQWVINNKSVSVLVRRGFPLVLDCASTAFMMQGETLKAEIAECGDIFTEPTMDEVLTTYVILSHVKCVCSLLLLRAFCPNLFRMGTPPGPACMIKHLKQRLGTAGEASAVPYSKADATQEYDDIHEKWKFEHQARRKQGLEWPCASCHLHFPAEAFIDDDRRKARDKGVIKNDATKEYCITPGHWRRCRACLGLRLDGLNGTVETHIMIECKHRRHRRPQQYFQESTSKCSSCLFQDTYECFECAECHKTTSMKERNGASIKANTGSAIIARPRPQSSSARCATRRE